VPSMTTPSKPYAWGAIGDMLGRHTRDASASNTPHWFVCRKMKDDRKLAGTGERHRLVPVSPRADAPSPNPGRPRRRRSSRNAKRRSAQPTATGSIAGRWADHRDQARAAGRPMCTFAVTSRASGRPCRPMNCAKIRPRFDRRARCGTAPCHGGSGRADVPPHPSPLRTPTDAASLPRPRVVERSRGILPWRIEDVTALLDGAGDEHVAVRCRGGSDPVRGLPPELH